MQPHLRWQQPQKKVKKKPQQRCLLITIITEAEAIKAVVGEPQGQEEHTEDTDNLGEQLEYTQTEHPRMHVHNTNNTENKHSIAENRCLVRGFCMLQEKPKTPLQQQHEK